MQQKNTGKSPFGTAALITLLSMLLFSMFSCKKQDEWLDVKSSKGNVTPSTLKNYQALMDYDVFMNDGYPGMPLVSADNYYSSYANWQGSDTYTRYIYIWDQDIYHGYLGINDWQVPYIITEYANIALEGLGKIARNSDNEQDWNNVKGSALFYRGYAFYNLAGEFAKPYTAATASKDPGIPLHLEADVNQRLSRGTVEQSYQQILSDLKQAEPLLPNIPLYQTRPCKAAVQALLARVYLNMDNYDSALVYAEKALQFNSTLIDFNTLNTSASKPFPAFPKNSEVLFYAASSYDPIALSTGMVDTTLYRSYAANDLRKQLFFLTSGSGNIFKGQYTGNSYPFGGLAINELYLIAAECYARKGNKDQAMQKLNALRVKRWKTGTYTSYTAVSADDALVQVLTERRKELPFTGTLRWEDLRRLNKESRFAVTLQRVLNNQNYTLPPNDGRYVLPIPDNDIRLGGLTQNPR